MSKMYAEIKDNKIMAIFCGKLPQKEKQGITITELKSYQPQENEDIRIYSDLTNGIKKPLAQLIEESFEEIPKGKKLNADGSDFEDMTEAEKWEAGLITLEPTQYLDDDADYPRSKTQEELLETGLITKDEYNEHVSNLRRYAFQNEADPLFYKWQRGEIEKQEWITKVKEIKNRYPKK